MSPLIIPYGMQGRYVMETLPPGIVFLALSFSGFPFFWHRPTTNIITGFGKTFLGHAYQIKHKITSYTMHIFVFYEWMIINLITKWMELSLHLHEAILTRSNRSSNWDKTVISSFLAFLIVSINEILLNSSLIYSLAPITQHYY